MALIISPFNMRRAAHCSRKTSVSSRMLEPIGAIIDAILAAPAPVVMPDTASLLNIIEASIHDERVSANLIPAVLSFLSRLQATPGNLHIVLSHVVQQEW